MNPVIVPVASQLQMTHRCIKSVQAQDIEVTPIILDNGAVDCAHYLRTVPNSIVISFRPAQGLHYVWNRALRFLFDQLHCDHALVINNDTVLRPDTYRLLVNSGYDFVSGISVDKMEAMRKVDVESSSPHPDFSCFLMRRIVWDKVGVFEEDFTYYAGDCSYHVRMHRKGMKAYAIDLPFYHERSSTIKNATNEERDRIQACADRDRETFRQKYGCNPWEPEYAELFREDLCR